jgi:DNA-binding NtrC family response regulator
LRNLCERMVILFAGRRVAPENLPYEIRAEGHATAGGNFVLPSCGICLEELEQTMIRQALERTHGNRSRAARLLGLTRDTLLYRLKKYAIA